MMDDAKELVPAGPPKPKRRSPSGRPKCGGKLHRREGFCTQPAGWGTDHPGEGRCKLHGGVSGRRTHGLCSKIKSKSLRELIEYFKENPYEGVEDELCTARALLVDYLNRTKDEGRDINALSRLVERITRIVERKYRMEHDKPMSQSQLMRVLHQMAYVVEVEVQDQTCSECGARLEFAEKVKERIKNAWNLIRIF